MVLALVCALVWFNRIGLPDFLKKRLVATLQTRGIELEFTRMRLHFVHGLVVENVRLGHAAAPDDPVLSLAEVQLQLNYHALLRRQWQVDGLILRQGKFVWPLAPTHALTLDNIQTELRFQTNNTWSLDHFQADFAGAKLALSGDLSHAPEIRNWDIFHGQKSAGRAVWQARLRNSPIRSTGCISRHATIEPGRGGRRAGHSHVRHPVEPECDLDSNPWGGARDIQLTGNLTAPAGTPTNFVPAGAWWTTCAAVSVDLDGEIQGLEIRKAERGLRRVQRPLAGHPN